MLPLDNSCSNINPDASQTDLATYIITEDRLQASSNIVSSSKMLTGADTFDVDIKINEKRFGFDVDVYGGSNMLLETKMTVTAVGKPKQFVRKEKASYYSDLSLKWDV